MPSRGAVLGALPFAIVFALALGLAIAAFVATPPRHDRSATPVPATSVAVPSAQAPTPAGTPAASTKPGGIIAGANDPAQMLRVHNELRLAVGAPAVRTDDRVTAAAQRHAEYLATNDALGHDETPGAPGFTGISVRDRLAAQGYPATTASEVATSFGAGSDGVRSLWILPYHRLGLMHPHAIVAAWGHAEVGGRSTTVGVIVYDFGSAAPDLVRSPAAGQHVAGSWDGEESPDVLPAGAARPVGYPIMAVYAKARSAELRGARLTDPSGREIPTYTVPQIYERDYLAIVPRTPLAAATRYHVRFDVRLGTVDVSEEWDFETDR